MSEGRYDEEVLRIVCTCWTNVHDSDPAALDSTPLEKALQCTTSGILSVQRSRRLCEERMVSLGDIEKMEPALKKLWK
jgi:hypothetical protein